MNFRRTANRRDEYQRLAQRSRPDFEATGLPPDLYRTESALVDFLSSGTVAASDRPNEVRLDELSDEAFGRLENAINMVFPDGWHQLSLTAFAKERLRRFGRHA